MAGRSTCHAKLINSITMANPRIYQNIELEINQQIELDKSASHHLCRVLRLKNRQLFTIFNGDGFDYPAELILDRKKTFARILQQTENHSRSSLNITLLQGISKGERMDMAIQKSVELGVERIIPVICKRTVVNLKAERTEKKRRHWQGIVTHACEQSGRASLPVIDNIMSFSDALTSLNAQDTKITLDPYSEQTLISLQPADNKNFSLLIGPEGGLSEEELAQAKEYYFTGIQMGPRILRTETAALSAISAIQTLWGDFRLCTDQREL